MIFSRHMLQTFISYTKEEETARTCKALNKLRRVISLMAVIFTNLNGGKKNTSRTKF